MTDISAAPRSEDAPIGGSGAKSPLIVVGLDWSPSSWDAFAWATGEATRAHGRLLAVHVMAGVEPYAPWGAPFDYAAAKQARDLAADQLEAEAKQRAHHAGIELVFIRQIGDPAAELSRVAQAQHADLIVVGRSAKMLHQLAGSLGRRLVSRHDVPAVVVVP
jgi:nucleotide-binding universal stress UspA family protein